MSQTFQGWDAVSFFLHQYADNPGRCTKSRGYRLNAGQCASLRFIANHIHGNGMILADEVGMGKTCIAVELTRAVVRSGGRVAILVPPGLGYQWHDELDRGDISSPLILRSFWQYLAAWEQENNLVPWFQESVNVISHAFCNWRLGENSDPWRWALLPELYAVWQKKSKRRYPRGYRNNEKLDDTWVRNAARSICQKIIHSDHPDHDLIQLMGNLTNDTPWPAALDGSAYGRWNALREKLEQAVGLGLGVFDLIIIDEAHKSRGTESGLSRLLDNVIIPSKLTRRLAMTATPVELDLSQWNQTLARINLDGDQIVKAKETIEKYSVAVQNVRQCPNNIETRRQFCLASKEFKSSLAPYLLRRDKREDSAVSCFADNSGKPFEFYRNVQSIEIDTISLSDGWKRAVCAAEALSLSTAGSENILIKRLRLTVGNGHGISTLLNHSGDHIDEASVEDPAGIAIGKKDYLSNTDKREERVKWWLKTLQDSFLGNDSLFDHPAILAATLAIEHITAKGEKVLVFGRFTKPLQKLVELINARELLRSLQEKRPWPQEKINENDKKALEVAHRQLNSNIPIASIEEKLAIQYQKLENQRRTLRDRLMDNINDGLKGYNDSRIVRIFEAFKEVVRQNDRLSLILVSRAMYELLDDKDASKPAAYAEAFAALCNALSDKDEGDTDGDGELSQEEANDLWPYLRERLDEEYNRSQGRFARLMYGGTRQETRRVIQLAFNRRQSAPQVLVAQSMVGREGLNLHKACRHVILLHPEWNPGVVEQQIGRVDRVGSHWSVELKKAINDKQSSHQLPSIEIFPVIFKGTYDEYNWKVLQERWDELRAQLHGIVIPANMVSSGQVDQRLAETINNMAPNFSPNYFVGAD